MKLSRRDMIASTAGALFGCAMTTKAAPARSQGSRISMESYIFQQYVGTKKEKLGDDLDQLFAMAHDAGFHNIELNDGFFAADMRDRVVGIVQSHGLRMPSVYVGGAMHEQALADATIEKSLAIARLCKPAGCHALVGDPTPKPAQAEKTDAELATQATMCNQLGKALAAEGFQYWIHNHDVEMVNDAREWWSNLKQTDPKYVWMCIDLDWVHQGGQDPLALLRAAGKRVACLHLRNSTNKLWLESFTDGDIDYRAIAAYLKSAHIEPLLMVELAYRPTTTVTRPLEEDLQLSRVYAEEIFKVRA